MMHPKILVTGGSGLLGSYVLRYLKHRGYQQLTATYQEDTSTIPEDLKTGILWKPLKLPDPLASLEIMEGHDWVIHNAGYISYDRRQKNKLLAINQTGTKHIVDACLIHEVKHLLYIGSIGALGKEKNHVTLNEATSWLDNEYSTSYGLSKYLGELEVWRGAGEGLPVSVVLPSVILGTGDWHRSSLQIIDRVAKKTGWYPSGQTGFVDVRDLASFITTLLERDRSGERWLLNGSNMPYADLYRKIAGHLQPDKRFYPAPKWAAKLYLQGRGLLSGAGIGSEVLNHMYSTFWYDGSRSLTIEGFKYRDLDRSIRDIAEVYRGDSDLLSFEESR